MAWVWLRPKEDNDWGADFDLQASPPMRGTECLGNTYLDPAVYRPLFRSQVGLKRFKALHCPPFGVYTVVDSVWKSIILDFVPSDRIQFLPVRLVAREEICDDYFTMIIFDAAYCIDPEKSWITRSRKKDEDLFIFGVAKFVHLPNCLGNLHIARDYRMRGHIVVSEALKEALASTGEDSMFYRPEDIVTLDTQMAMAKVKAGKLN